MGGGRSKPPMVFCPLIKKIFRQPIPKILDFSQLLVTDTPMKFFFDKFCLHPLNALLGHLVQKYFFIFCFNQKNFFQTLVEIIFRYHEKIPLDFWDALGPPYNRKEENENFTYGVLAIKIG